MNSIVSIFFFCGSFFLLACGQGSKSEQNSKSDSISTAMLSETYQPERSAGDTIPEREINPEDEMLLCFAVICDTSYNYWGLRNVMLKTAVKLHLSIDSMGRFYNTVERRIQLPEDSEDEIFAGEYFPRRDPSESFSIEYASQYMDNTNDSLLACIAGIYEKKEEAELRLKQIAVLNKNAFIVEASLFQGCMH